MPPLGQSGDITPGNSCDGPSSFRFSGPITYFTTSFCRSSQQHANVKCTWVNLMNFDFRLAIYGSIIDGMGKLGGTFYTPQKWLHQLQNSSAASINIPFPAKSFN